MALAEDRSVKTAVEPRLLAVQADRASRTIHATVVSSPFWAALFGFVTSDQTPYFGLVPSERSLAQIVMVCGAVIAAQLILMIYHRERDAGIGPDAAKRWLDRFFYLAVFLSAIWGCALWLLWDANDRVNHIFVTLACLAVVSRFVIHRANHLRFFLGSFLPLTALLAARLIFAFEPMELLLAALVPLYAVQVVMDTGNISQRWDREAETRFSFEDMSRALEEARDEALRKRAEAEAANASKTSFMANMSHELRTPLNAILGFSEVIAHEYLGPVGSPRYREYAVDIHNSGTHLLTLINDLLDVAKIEAGRMEIAPCQIDIRAAFDDALKLVGARARERGQTLTITIEEPAAALYADERAVKQIVINLAANAIKFTQERGRIDVYARRNRQRDFELMVSDNGPGIAKAKLERVFTPFARADNRYNAGSSGTGLGLALVKGLAELHGGRAWLESEEGKGTRVFVTLPDQAGAQSKRASA